MLPTSLNMGRLVKIYSSSKQYSYQITQEVPFFGAHIIQSHPSIHETADSVARREGEGLVL